MSYLFIVQIFAVVLDYKKYRVGEVIEIIQFSAGNGSFASGGRQEGYNLLYFN